MTTALSRQLPRTLIAAGLAIAGTLASFTVTATPAFAGPVGNKATLSAGVAAPAKKIVNGVTWRCEEAKCTGAADGSNPVTTCAKVVRAFGPVSAFATAKGELSADQLERCNAAG
jgi:hypothetical protein